VSLTGGKTNGSPCRAWVGAIAGQPKPENLLFSYEFFNILLHSISMFIKK
jgi:hypothetical protein